MNKKNKDSVQSSLRQKAEKLYPTSSSISGSQLSEAEVMKLMHELQVHQIELQMQNEELLEAKEKADQESNRFTELYDFAPSGYFTLTREGQIIELNLVGAKLLGIERSRLKNRLFGSFVAEGSLSIFNQFILDVFNKNSTKSYEVKIRGIENSFRNVIIAGTISLNGEHCFVTATDITNIRQIEENLLESESRLKFHTDNSPMATIEDRKSVV